MKACLKSICGDYGPATDDDPLIFLPEGEFVVGRGQGCQLRVWSKCVSRRHCVITTRGTEVWLRDLGSRNGTRLNNRPITGDMVLCHGDLLGIGPLLFRFVLESECNGHPRVNGSAPKSRLTPQLWQRRA